MALPAAIVGHAGGHAGHHRAAAGHAADGDVVGHRSPLGLVTVPTSGRAGRAAQGTSPRDKSVTGSLKTTVKLIGPALVGSSCVAAWSIVTVGCVGHSHSMIAGRGGVGIAGQVRKGAAVHGGDDAAVAGHAADGDVVGHLIAARVCHRGHQRSRRSAETKINGASGDLLHRFVEDQAEVDRRGVGRERLTGAPRRAW